MDFRMCCITCIYQFS